MLRRSTLQTSVARNLCTLLLLAIVASAHADWNALSVEQDAGRTGIEHRHVVVEDTGLSQRADVDVVVFSAKSCALRVIDNPEGESLSTIMKREKCVCSVNGGYFDPEFKPIGLRISNGETFSPLRRFLQRVLVRTRGWQRVFNCRPKTGARFCRCRSEVTSRLCHPERSERSQIVSVVNAVKNDQRFSASLNMTV